MEIDGLRILVLGCHDLNMFNPRILANPRLGLHRRRRCKKMQSLARKFKPTIVISHPHQTDTLRIWLPGWCGVKKILPFIKQRLSGIAYYPPNWEPTTRQELPVVLRGTKFGPKIEDVVVKGFP